jgi:hypothetical protein
MDIEIHEAVRDGIARAVAAVGLAGVALIHLLDLPGQLSEAPLVFGLYVALMLASVALAAAVIWRSDTRSWAMAAVLPALVIVAYVLSRTSGLPGSTDDIGNWSEPLGMASLFVEGALVVLSSAVLVSRSEVAFTGGHASRRQALQRAREGTAAPAQRSAGL